MTDSHRAILAMRDTPRLVLENSKGIRRVCPECKRRVHEHDILDGKFHFVSFCQYCGQRLDFGRG